MPSARDSGEDWLDRFNRAAELANNSLNAEAFEILDGLPLLASEPTLTPRFFVMFELRRADLHSRLGDRDEALRRFRGDANGRRRCAG